MDWVWHKYNIHLLQSNYITLQNIHVRTYITCTYLFIHCYRVYIVYHDLYNMHACHYIFLVQFKDFLFLQICKQEANQAQVGLAKLSNWSRFSLANVHYKISLCQVAKLNTNPAFYLRKKCTIKTSLKHVIKPFRLTVIKLLLFHNHSTEMLQTESNRPPLIMQ